MAIVNLLGLSSGGKEGEAALSAAYQNHHRFSQGMRDVGHVLYDFHAEVKAGDKGLSKLMGQVKGNLGAQGFFTKKADTRLREQSGVIRTNCTDCLDRTNSAQTAFALSVLSAQIASLDMGEVSPSVAYRLSETFKAMWANSGNELSKIYAGTGVIGTSSKLVDGARSAARTVQNNLLDSAKQEAFDRIVTGGIFKTQMSHKTLLYLPRLLIINNEVII